MIWILFLFYHKCPYSNGAMDLISLPQLNMPETNAPLLGSQRFSPPYRMGVAIFGLTPSVLGGPPSPAVWVIFRLGRSDHALGRSVIFSTLNIGLVNTIDKEPGEVFAQHFPQQVIDIRQDL